MRPLPIDPIVDQKSPEFNLKSWTHWKDWFHSVYVYLNTLGTIATQMSNYVTITGGNISNVTENNNTINNSTANNPNIYYPYCEGGAFYTNSQYTCTSYNGIFNNATINTASMSNITMNMLSVLSLPTASATLSDHSIPVLINGQTMYMRLSSNP